MTNAQFAALAELIGLKGGRSQEAARLVLVEGIDVGSVALRLGISQPAVSKAIRIARKGYAGAPHVLALAERALGLPEREADTLKRPVGPAVITRELPVSELGLSVRTSNRLKKEGIATLGDLLGCSFFDVAKLPDIGRAALTEIERVANVFGGLRERPATAR